MPHHKRPLLVIIIGAVIAVAGVIIFLSAHALATPGMVQTFVASERDRHEMLWATFGIAIWLGGVIVASVGLSAWARDGA